MIKHCLDQLPNEACGLLSGRKGRAETIWKMENMAHSPVSFRMDEGQLRNVFDKMGKIGEELVGIYHSHPTAPAIPSPLDIICATYQEIPYVIVSLAARMPAVGCYRISGKTPHALPIVIR